MLSKSLGAARTVVRDVFRSADSRRNREHCWTDSADEWGLNAARAEVSSKLSTKEASDDTFFTSRSFQSNLTDVGIPAPSADKAIIKDGPQRYVRDVKSGPAVQETYLVLERVSGCDGPGHLTRAEHPDPEEDARGNRPRPRMAAPGAADKGLCEPGEGEGRRNGATASTLFAYRAMKTREQGGKATREHDAATCRELWDIETHETHETAMADAASARAASDFTNNYDISDDEGDSPGRISPRTFRLWATGCCSQQQRDHDVQEDVHHLLPASNTDMDAGSTPASSSSSSSSSSPTQTQPALTNDASTWSSDSESLARAKWNHIVQWQHKMPRPRSQPQPHPSSPGQVITLTNHDILSALSHPSAPPFPCHVPLASIHSALRTRYQLLVDSRHAETRMADLRNEAQARIDDLVAGKAKAPDASSRTDTDADADAESTSTSRDEIYRHVEGHLADVADMYRCSQARVRALADEVDSLMERERELRMCLV